MVREARQEVGELDAVAQLAAGVAHHFNNLHMVALGNLELMREELPEGSPAQRRVSAAIGSLERAALLTRQLMSFSGRQAARPKALDLNQLILELQPELQRLAGDRIDLELELDPGLDRAYADRSHLEQLLSELVLNGRDAIVSERGQLTISTSCTGIEWGGASGGSILLEVADSGCGMDEATLGRMFEPFFTTRDVGKGAGMGLAAVHGIVKQLEGNIWVRSSPGNGTRLSIAMPRAMNSTGEARASGSQTPILAAEQARAVVMVVEDDQNLRGLIRQLLERAGFSVLEAPNGKEALELCEAAGGTVRLVLTDLMMPEMSPEEFHAGLAQSFPTVPVITMSGLGPGVAARHGIHVTGDSFLQKPFTPATLIRQVGAMLAPAASSADQE